MVHQVLAHKNKRRKEENLFEIFSFVQKNRNSSRNFHDLDPHLYPIWIRIHYFSLRIQDRNLGPHQNKMDPKH